MSARIHIQSKVIFSIFRNHGLPNSSNNPLRETFDAIRQRAQFLLYFHIYRFIPYLSKTFSNKKGILGFSIAKTYMNLLIFFPFSIILFWMNYIFHTTIKFLCLLEYIYNQQQYCLFYHDTMHSQIHPIIPYGKRLMQFGNGRGFCYIFIFTVLFHT